MSEVTIGPVRDDARGLGLGLRLYDMFTAAALERGAVGRKL
jgi:hypothetical protein